MHNTLWTGKLNSLLHHLWRPDVSAFREKEMQVQPRGAPGVVTFDVWANSAPARRLRTRRAHGWTSPASLVKR